MKTTPVLVAGGGPVGMTVALELGRRGIPCMLIERNESTTQHPKMDITNGRSMELFRRMGIVSELRSVAVPPGHAFDVSWITNFAGHELHRFRYDSVDDAKTRIREHNDGSQALEPPMRVSQVEIEPVLKRAIEANPLIDVRFGVGLEEFVQDAMGVTVTLRRKSDDGIESVRCAYLIGCDGGNSQVRRCLGTPLTGTSSVMQRFMTHFKADAGDILMRWGVAWHYQSANGTLIAQNDKDTWTLHTRMPVGGAQAVDPSALIRQFTGVDFPHEVLVANPWVPHLLVAEKYQVGRVLIAGDAAHQYIPTGGYGMNTGIGDAYDVAWKVAAMLKGFGGEGLLSAYEAERRPVGIRNREASRHHNNVRVEIGRLYGEPLGAEGETGEAARSYVSEKIRRIGNAENESFGIELGYVYADSPVVIHEFGTVAPSDPLRYEPTTMPGARLPSVFLANGTPLYDRLGDWFTLLIFNNDQDAAGLFIEAAKRRGIPFSVVRLNEPRLRAAYDAPLILVRPDQHVAWRGSRIRDALTAECLFARALGWIDSGVVHV